MLEIVDMVIENSSKGNLERRKRIIDGFIRLNCAKDSNRKAFISLCLGKKMYLFTSEPAEKTDRQSLFSPSQRYP